MSNEKNVMLSLSKHLYRVSNQDASLHSACPPSYNRLLTPTYTKVGLRHVTRTWLPGSPFAKWRLLKKPQLRGGNRISLIFLP